MRARKNQFPISGSVSRSSKNGGIDDPMAISNKGRQLLELYTVMAKEGYRTVDLQTIESAFNSMELRAFRQPIKQVLTQFRVNTLLDYGCGGSDYEAAGFDEQLSAREYFGLSQVFRYEPARNLDQRQKVDAVLCFDVLEHLFIADVATTVRELFSLASRLLIVNTACYAARALLPNGENAHITVRPPHWWKGMFDSIACEFPQVSVWLLCSTAYRQAQSFDIWSGSDWLNSSTFVTTK
jgi:hypothetical protein